MPIRILEAYDHGWGDYGRIAVNGMAHLGRARDGSIQLERSGRFMPPITFPHIGELVVTSAFRSRLEGSGLRGFSFRPVTKARIVDLDWRHWDPDDDPADMPESGEPEDLLLARPHDPLLSDALGELWELQPAIGAVIERRPNSKSRFGGDIVLKLASWEGADLFRAEGVGYNYASARAQAWLADNASEWVEFRDCLVE